MLSNIYLNMNEGIIFELSFLPITGHLICLLQFFQVFFLFIIIIQAQLQLKSQSKSASRYHFVKKINIQVHCPRTDNKNSSWAQSQEQCAETRPVQLKLAWCGDEGSILVFFTSFLNDFLEIFT